MGFHHQSGLPSSRQAQTGANASGSSHELRHGLQWSLRLAALALGRDSWGFMATFEVPGNPSNHTINLPPSAVPLMYWNLPMPPSPEGVVGVGGIDVGGVGMPGCPPGWDSSPARADKWTEWREDGDVETGFMRCVVMRGQGDAQSSGASVRPTLTFTNPFNAGASHSFLSEAEAELSPLDGSELDGFRLPPPPAPDMASGGYATNPFGLYRHAAAAAGGDDQLEFDLGSLMPRLLLAEDSQA
ncbi:hypothetical protein PQX77_000871 [Marasmius sp. AFHP31]|nr:hypothetical protein PQX77_000871 [Marasmius sp. AFHP31]